jgi:hypothetical protein
MNEEVERIWKEAPAAFSKYHPGSCLAGLRKITETILRIAGVPVEIRTEHLSNTRIER